MFIIFSDGAGDGRENNIRERNLEGEIVLFHPPCLKAFCLACRVGVPDNGLRAGPGQRFWHLHPAGKVQSGGLSQTC